MCRLQGPMSFAYFMGLLIIAITLIETVPLRSRCKTNPNDFYDDNALIVVSYWLLHLFTISLTILALIGVHIGKENLLLAAFMTTLLRCGVSFYLRIFELKHSSWFLCTAEDAHVYTRVMGFVDMLFIGALWLAWMSKRAENAAEEQNDRLSAVAYYRTLNSDAFRSVGVQSLQKRETKPEAKPETSIPIEVDTPSP